MTPKLVQWIVPYYAVLSEATMEMSAKVTRFVRYFVDKISDTLYNICFFKKKKLTTTLLNVNNIDYLKVATASR